MSLSRHIGPGVREQFVDVLGARRRRQIGYGPPPGFEAYARVLHPMDPGDRTVTPTMRWAELAERFGCSLASRTTWDIAPAMKGLPVVQGEALVGILAETTRMRACSFGVWCGFADLDHSLREATMLDVASRETYLFEGDLSDATTNLYERDGVVPGYRAMNVWLPPGAPWMVSTDLYATNTLVAGSEEPCKPLCDHADSAAGVSADS